MAKAKKHDGRKLYRVDGIGMAILHILWASAAGRTIRTIFDTLYAAQGISFCTVQTTIRRMQAAGVVKKARRLKGYRADIYVAARSQEDECAKAVNGVLTAFFNGKPKTAVLRRVMVAATKMKPEKAPGLRGQK